MTKSVYNFIGTLIGLVAVIIFIIFTFGFRKELGWWAFMDVFALFMCVFSHLMALMLRRMSLYAAKRMDIFAWVFGILFIIALVIEYVIYSYCI